MSMPSSVAAPRYSRLLQGSLNAWKRCTLFCNAHDYHDETSINQTNVFFINFFEMIFQKDSYNEIY